LTKPGEQLFLSYLGSSIPIEQVKPKLKEKCEEGLVIRYVQALGSNIFKPTKCFELDNLLPFHCLDCGISFRSQWRLEKHLQSGVHIASMEEWGVLPKGSLDEIERQGIDLYELNSSDYVTLLQTLQQLPTR
jgi:hypothetical protein